MTTSFRQMNDTEQNYAFSYTNLLVLLIPCHLFQGTDKSNRQIDNNGYLIQWNLKQIFFPPSGFIVKK